MWRKRATPLHHWITGGAVTAAKIWSRERTRMLSGFPNPEHLRGELRIDFDELRGDDGPQDAQRLGGRSGRHRHVRRLVEIKPVCSTTSATLWPGCTLASAKRRRCGSKLNRQRLVMSAIGLPGRCTLSGLVPGALMKSTFATSVRRLCSSRNRITLGTT